MHQEQDDHRQPGADDDVIQPAQANQRVSQPDLWAARLEAWVRNLNIERFRAQLAAATDERQRFVLSRLLGEHEADRRQVTSPFAPDERTGGHET